MVLSPESLPVSDQQKFSELAEKQLSENSNKDGNNFGLNLQDVIRQSKVVSQIVLLSGIIQMKQILLTK